ncbi:uncharacterized protein LOC135829310 [Sycon ciliatum]|uniref:uncharacterized protein LOC135829310 n=1 Tax=Sycon ciliatum TaxID=27933 RepID=UPI0031F66AA0
MPMELRLTPARRKRRRKIVAAMILQDLQKLCVRALKLREDERVTVAEPSAETASPFHSIFALEVGCGDCDKATGDSYQGTCFLLSDLNSAATKDYIIFATAAHNLVCNRCGDWLWVRIYKDLSAPPLTSEEISRKNDYGGLIVPTWYKNNAKDPEKTNEKYLHDYGIIAVKTSKVCPLVKWADKLLGVATQCKKEEGVRMCGYPTYTLYGGIEKPAKKCKYWVKEDRLATFAEHDHHLHHFVDSTGGQSGSPVFLLPKGGEAETASATGYVVGIHIAGSKEHNYAVKIRDEHGHDTKPMADLREWAKNPSAFLPEESVAVVCSEKSVKPGVMPSEQIGLHGGRLVISGPEEPKKMYESLDMNPWESVAFKELLPYLVSTLIPLDMRLHCQDKKLITHSERLKFASCNDLAAQNEALFKALRVGNDESFHKLLECIRQVEPSASVRMLLDELEPLDKFGAARQH